MEQRFQSSQQPVNKNRIPVVAIGVLITATAIAALFYFILCNIGPAASVQLCNPSTSEVKFIGIGNACRPKFIFGERGGDLEKKGWQDCNNELIPNQCFKDRNCVTKEEGINKCLGIEEVRQCISMVCKKYSLNVPYCEYGNNQ